MQTATQSATIAPIRFIPVTGAAATGPKTNCSHCHLKDLCLPGGLGGTDVQRLDSLMFARRRLREGQPLYHEGETFEFLYAVRSGTFKSFVSSKDGREQVSAYANRSAHSTWPAR
jgi:CRP/FNR family transcriptional regulator, anaerobic regulatory protein